MRVFGWLMALALSTAAAQAGVMFNNFGSGLGYDLGNMYGVGGIIQGEWAARFTPAYTGTLDDIVLAEKHSVGTNGQYSIGLWTNAGGVPGAPMESWLSVTFTPGGGTMTMTSSSHPLLTAGTIYWIVMSGGAADTIGGWYDSTAGSMGMASNNNVNQAWSYYGEMVTAAFAVDGTASGAPPSNVPEPGTMGLVLAGGTAALALQRRARR